MADTIARESATELYCSFWLSEHCFGVPSTAVSQVHAPAHVTTIPGAPSAVHGYVNLRGQLYLVLDPSELLLARPQAESKNCELIVFRAEVGEAFAIAVERVGDILAIPQARIHVLQARSDNVELSVAERRSTNLILGYARLDELLVTLVEPRKLLPSAFSSAHRELELVS